LATDWYILIISIKVGQLRQATDKFWYFQWKLANSG